MTIPPSPSEILNTIQNKLRPIIKTKRFKISTMSNNLTISEACTIQAKKTGEETTTYNFQIGNLMDDSHRKFALWHTFTYKKIYFVFQVDEWVLIGNTI